LVRDHSALVIAQRERIRPGYPLPPYNIRHITRFERGTPYPEVVKQVCATLSRRPLCLHPLYCAIDQTGVGVAVAEMLRVHYPRAVPVTITAGHQVNVREDGSFAVPKAHLVSIVQSLLQSRLLVIAQNLKERPTLVEELTNFEVRVKLETGNEEMGEWRTGKHDDLVLATSLALFLGERVKQERALAAQEALTQTTWYT
jgi:hypothetical protein